MMEEDIFDDNEFEDDIDFIHQSQNPDDVIFDQIVEKLQEIVLEPQFENMSNQYLSSNCLTFERTQENKMEYLTIFKEYQALLDSYLQKELQQRLNNFNMDIFNDLLSSRQERIDPQLLDLLISLSDFESFKSLMIDHKTQILSQSKKKSIKTTVNNENIFKQQNLHPEFQKPLKKIQKMPQVQNQQNEPMFNIQCTPMVSRKN